MGGAKKAIAVRVGGAKPIAIRVGGKQRIEEAKMRESVPYAALGMMSPMSGALAAMQGSLEEFLGTKVFSMCF